MLLTISFLAYVASFTVVAATIIVIFIKYSQTYWKKRGVYSPPSLFPFGHFKQLFTMQMTMGANLKVYYDKYKQKGHKFIGLYVFHQPSLMIFDPTLIKTILTKDFEYFTDRNLFANEESDPLSGHLFNLSGHKWKTLRQKLTPTFTSGKLKQMFPTLLECSNELSDCLNEEIKKQEPIDIKKYFVQYTSDVIGSCAFGIECNSFKNPNSDFLKYGKKSFSPNTFDLIKTFFGNVCPSIATYIKLRITNISVHNFFMNLVKDTVEYRENNNVYRNDFMQLLLQLKNKGKVDDEQIDDGSKLTIDQIAAQVFIFFLAGFETSSTTLTFCLYELSKNSEIQNKTRNEIVSVLKKHGGQMTYDSLMEMAYTERVISETLRKHAPVMLLRRKVTKEYVIPDTDIVLEKGISVSIPTLGIHDDPEFYPEPEKFDPERFTEENKKTRPDYTWLPFGNGPRICIGMRFGMMQTKVGLCRLLLNYKFSVNSKTVEPLEMDPHNLINSAKHGIWLNAERI